MRCHPVNLVWVGIISYTAIPFITKDNFPVKIGILFQTHASPVSDQTKLSIVTNFEIMAPQCWGQICQVQVGETPRTWYGDLTSLPKYYITDLTDAAKTTWPPQITNIHSPLMEIPLVGLKCLISWSKFRNCLHPLDLSK